MATTDTLKKLGIDVLPTNRGDNVKSYLTAIGESLLPALDSKEKALSEYEMYNIDQQILKEAEKRGRIRAVEVVKILSSQLPPLEVGVSIVKLIRLGYLNESGFIRRFIEMTPKGSEILKKIA